ncbi:MULTISPECIES: nuclear transport factor 2 family protein [Amycolatopsis]|uniref:Nuclear transport factor 2 family protein n=1 Tax=Amycolatopsis dendrobii TaxID=2760662 RepID=A0A7W3ZB24_9PSEU|nr:MULTISPECIES: nuclear transport factor 2 family protein [Amycolatopsis]MBB1154452.1 nuclear transport factor 2 family protein [Amycolatopsis dendrobii]UKD51173.1 nuclear transport factor 2 family protein [Amycolatopsis sp. FU40]
MELTVDRVGLAFEALASGDRGKMLEYWDENVRFEIPGNHGHAGWYEGLDEFLGFLATVGEYSAGTYRAENVTVLVNPDSGYSVDINKNWAVRAGADHDSTSPYDKLDVDALHVLRWRDGKIVEGRGVLMGDGGTTSALWWSPIRADGTRAH